MKSARRSTTIIVAAALTAQLLAPYFAFAATGPAGDAKDANITIDDKGTTMQFSGGATVQFGAAKPEDALAAITNNIIAASDGNAITFDFTTSNTSGISAVSVHAPNNAPPIYCIDRAQQNIEEIGTIAKDPNGSEFWATKNNFPFAAIGKKATVKFINCAAAEAPAPVPAQAPAAVAPASIAPALAPEGGQASPATQPAAPAMSQQEVDATLKNLSATAMLANNIGVVRWVYGAQAIDAVPSELNNFKNGERQKTVDQFGRFVDDLPRAKAELIGEALSLPANNSQFDKNVVLAFDLAPLMAQLATSPMLATVYGNFLGKTADGQALGIVALPTTANVYLMHVDDAGPEILFTAMIENNIAKIPFSEIARLGADGDRLVLAVVNEFDPQAPTHVLPVAAAPLVAPADAPNNIDDLVARLRARASGIGELVTLLAQNGRAYTRLDGTGAPLARSGVGGFLAQLKDVFMRIIEKILGIFTARAAEPAVTITKIEGGAAIGKNGEAIAPIIRISGIGFTKRSVVTIGGVDQQTALLASGELVVGVIGDVAAAIGVKNYPPVAMEIAGSDFNPGAIVRRNGVDLVTTAISDGVLSALIPDEFLWTLGQFTIYNPISRKESSPAVEMWAIGFPLAQSIKDSVISAARNAGLALRPVSPSNPLEEYAYFYDLWKSVVAQMK